MSKRKEITVTIVGRPNVGKSTLFNRLIGRRKALVHDLPGVTRDRIEEEATWWVKANRVDVKIIDTGGLGGEHFKDEIAEQVSVAVLKSDIVLALFDGRTGVTPADEEVVRELKKANSRKVPIVAVVNKIDTEKHETLAHEFYSLGITPLVSVSAEHNRGIDDLLSVITGELEIPILLETEQSREENPTEETHSDPKVAVVGKPNTGKSTLINALIGESRMITSPIAGTTVDAVDSVAVINDQRMILIDTAGIRRKSKTEKGVEVLSVVQAKKALERCDVAILLLDGQAGITDQDEKIGGIIEKTGCGVIIAVNKWDTQVKNKSFPKEIAAEAIRKQMAFLKYAPIVFISAKKGAGFAALPDLVREIIYQRGVKVGTHEFTEFIRKETPVHNPMNAKFYMCHQSGRNPPTFVCHVNDTKKVHFSLKRHLVNAIRDRWGFMGSPVRLVFVSDNNERRK